MQETVQKELRASVFLARQTRLRSGLAESEQGFKVMKEPEWISAYFYERERERKKEEKKGRERGKERGREAGRLLKEV